MPTGSLFQPEAPGLDTRLIDGSLPLFSFLQKREWQGEKMKNETKSGNRGEKMINEVQTHF